MPVINLGLSLFQTVEARGPRPLLAIRNTVMNAKFHVRPYTIDLVLPMVVNT